MKYSLLTGDNIGGIGWNLSNALGNLGCSIIRCSNLFTELAGKCAEYKPDALVFFVTSESEELFSFVDKMVSEYPNMKIFVLSYVKSFQMRRRFEAAGITNFFLMPDLLSEICKYIVINLLPADEQHLMLDIMSYLGSKGISPLNSGFITMCIAMKLCILEPGLIKKITLRLYPCIAEELGSTPESVDQRLRRFSKSLNNNGVRFKQYNGKYPVSNSRMIKLALEEFNELYHSYTE